MCLSQILDVITTLALIITLFFIIKYTKETKKLREATVRHTELSLTPCITIYRKGGKVFLENIGKSPALNNRIESMEIPLFNISFPTIRLIEVGQHKELEIKMEAIDKETEAMRTKMEGDKYYNFPFFPPEIIKEDYFLIVQYENIMRELYNSKIKVNLADKKLEFFGICKVKKSMS